MDQFLEAQRSVVSGVLFDIRDNPSARPLIGVMTDELGISPQMFSNAHLRYAFMAAQDVYFRSIEARTNKIELPDVLSNLEENYRRNGHEVQADRLLADWRSKLDGPAKVVGDPVANAKILRNGQLVQITKQETKSFLERLHSTAAPDSVIADFAALLQGLESKRGHGVTLQATMDSVGANNFRPESTGYRRLDGHGMDGFLSVKGHNFGGYMPGRLLVMIGAPGAGKSTTAVNLAARRAEVGKPTVFHSFEMDRASLFRTMVACSARVSPRYAFSTEYLDSTDTQEIARSREAIDMWVRVYDEPTNITGVTARIRRHQVEFGNDLVLHIIDHIGAFVESNKSAWQQIQTLGRTFKDIGKLYYACILALAHPNPGSNLGDEFKKNNRLTNTSHVGVYGGRGLTQWADSMWVVHRHSGVDESGAPAPRFFHATIFQGIKNRQGKGIAEDTYFALDFDPITEHLSQTVLLDDQADIFN